VGAEVTTPLWVTLGIFSFNAFVALNFPRVEPPLAGPPVSQTARVQARAALRQLEAPRAPRSRKR
jgi:hypothetical protein